MFRLQGTHLSRARARAHTHTHIFIYEYILCFAMFSVFMKPPILNHYILKRNLLKERIGLNLTITK